MLREVSHLEAQLAVAWKGVLGLCSWICTRRGTFAAGLVWSVFSAQRTDGFAHRVVHFGLVGDQRRLGTLELASFRSS